MPVYKLLDEMPYTELRKWVAYFTRRPVGWREDQRAYLFLKTQGLKASPESVFPSLKQLKVGQIEKQKPDQAKPSGKFVEMMLSAKNGDDSGWKPNWKKK